MSRDIVITEKSSQARDVRAALGNRYGPILPAEGHLIALREASLATGLDCSSFISDDGMSMNVAVRRRRRTIVPIEKD